MITTEERQARRHFIGSSDIAALAGCDPWKSRLHVFLEKVYDTDDLPNKGPIARGNRYERVLLDFAEEKLGVELERNVRVVHPSIPYIAVNLDARLSGARSREGVEAKTANVPLASPDSDLAYSDQYGDPGTDSVPDRVLCQTHLQMDAADLEVMHVPVLLARFGRLEESMFRVERNEDLITSLREVAEEFWYSFVLPKIPPPLDGQPPIDVVARIKRVTGKTAPLDPSLVDLWEVSIKEEKIAKDRRKAVQAAVLARLGDAEIGDYGHASKWLTYYSQHRAGYTVEPTDYRVARISKRF